LGNLKFYFLCLVELYQKCSALSVVKVHKRLVSSSPN